jgi:hypothetical protein
MIHKLSLEIDYAHESSGWIDCWLGVDGEKHHLDASDVLPPFLGLLNFMRAIVVQRLPASFYWDEEGTGAEFTATPLAGDSSSVHLNIRYLFSGQTWLDAGLERQAIIQAFLPPLLDFSANYPESEIQWGLPRRAIARFQQKFPQGFPARRDAGSPAQVQFSLSSNYAALYHDKGYVFFEIEVGEDEPLELQLHDSDPFWPGWLDFVGRIAAGDLPVQCEQRRSSDFFPGLLPVQELTTGFSAEAVAAPDNFRFKIFIRQNQEEAILLLEQEVERRPFVRGFAECFAAFLREDYQVSPDSDDKTFDLRSLPRDGLQI